MDSLAISESKNTTSAVTSNETMILSSSVITSLILWRHYSGELMEYLLSPVKCPSFFVSSLEML